MTLRLADSPTIHGPEPIQLAGRDGLRYWVSQPRTITGHDEVDQALSSYPLVVFLPPGRDPARTPVVIALQGMAAPYQWSGFILPALLDMGIACALFDAPLAGERSLIRDSQGVILRQVIPLLDRGIPFTTAAVVSMINVVAADMSTVLAHLRERHGLVDSRVALFGVSLGCLLSALAFTRDGVGQRLLGAIGHTDLRLFARSYTPWFAHLLRGPAAGPFARVLSALSGVNTLVIRQFTAVLRDLCGVSPLSQGANPMTYAERVGGGRRVRLLVGREDRLVRVGDAARCAGRFADGQSFVVPGLGHGISLRGPSYEEHVVHFLTTQLADWAATES